MFLGQAFLESLEARELGKVHFSSVDLIQRHKTKTLWQRDVKGHTGCVNALEFSKDENYLLSGKSILDLLYILLVFRQVFDVIGKEILLFGA